MPDWFALVVGALATYWIARTVTLEEGPFGLFARVRSRLGGDEQITWLGRGVNCPKCAAVYAALVVTLLFWLGWLWLVAILALAGGATILYLWIEA